MTFCFFNEISNRSWIISSSVNIMISIIGYCCIWSCRVVVSEEDVLNLKQPAVRMEQLNLCSSLTWLFFFATFVLSNHAHTVKHIPFLSFPTYSKLYTLPPPPDFKYIITGWIINRMKGSLYEHTTKHKDLDGFFFFLLSTFRVLQK